MLELFRDPLWQFIGAVVGILAFTATIIIFFVQRKKKSFSYEVLSSSSLLSLKEEIEGKLEILYNDTPVKKVHLIVIKFFNSGNTPIEANDYERPLSIAFGENAQIISHEINETTPSNLQIEYKIQNDKITFTPCLMNENDNYIMKFLVSDYQGHIDADARISGVNEVREESPRYSASLILASIGGLVSLGGLIMTLINSSPIEKPIFDSQIEAISVGIFVAGYIIMSFSFTTSRRLRKQIQEKMNQVVISFR